MLIPRLFDNSLSVYLFLEFEPQLDKSEKFNNQAMKENRAFRIHFLTKKQLKSRQACTKFSYNPNTKFTEVFQSSISAHPFLMFSVF